MFFHAKKGISGAENGTPGFQELADEQLTQVVGGCDTHKKPVKKDHHRNHIHHPSPSSPSSPSQPGSPSHRSH